jgi:hypothetical protein
VRYATILVLGAVVVSLCGCGSSSRQADTYSVQQVEAAFVAHGLPLRQAPFGPASGVVKLLRPGLEVDVETAGSPQWITIEVQSRRSTQPRNLFVDFAPRYSKPVGAALRQLRSHA